MIRKCFSEEVKASNRNWKVNGSAVCFLYNIFFLCYFYHQSLCCFNLLLSSGKVGGSENSRLLGGCEKKRLLNGVENGPADITCAVRNDQCLPEHKFRVLFATGQ